MSVFGDAIRQGAAEVRKQLSKLQEVGNSKISEYKNQGEIAAKSAVDAGKKSLVATDFNKNLGDTDKDNTTLYFVIAALIVLYFIFKK